MRLANGHEALVVRVVTSDDRIGYGFSLRLDATAARHMAEWNAGVRTDRPHIEPLLGHPWEASWTSGSSVDWNAEPAFVQIRWLPC